MLAVEGKKVKSVAMNLEKMAATLLDKQVPGWRDPGDSDMDSNIKRSMAIGLLVAGALATGACSRGATAGGLIGGAGGAVVGDATGLGTTEGAVIGGTAGAIIGDDRK